MAETPAVAVMTTRFVSAAELMARVLGLPGYPFAVIEHPVSSAPDAELAQRAGVVLIHIEDMIPATAFKTGAE